jgi:hypothetical protein
VVLEIVQVIRMILNFPQRTKIIKKIRHIKLSPLVKVPNAHLPIVLIAKSIKKKKKRDLRSIQMIQMILNQTFYLLTKKFLIKIKSGNVKTQLLPKEENGLKNWGVLQSSAAWNQ